MTSGPEHRRCPVTEVYTVVSPARLAANAHGGLDGGLPVLGGPCPFCMSPAYDAEPAILTVEHEGRVRVRVVPNKYPAVHARAEHAVHGLAARGVHELVIESDVHDDDLITYDDAQLLRLFRVLRDRVRALESTPSVEHVAVFRNRGKRAGASQPHPHAQLVGMHVPGREQVTRLETALRFHARTGGNLGADIVRRERAQGERIVADEAGMVSLTAFAPRRTREAWVMPDRAIGSLAAFDDETLAAFARAIQVLTRGLLEVSGRTDYNVTLRTLPVAYRDHPAAFTYAEVIPRGGAVAGFEITTGAGLVAVTPESLARELTLHAERQ
jgi:UDPglucose--hexose-1-phosphate uridylyltransferase